VESGVARAASSIAESPAELIRPQRRAEPPVTVDLSTPVPQPEADSFPEIVIRSTLSLPTSESSVSQFAPQRAPVLPRPAEATPARPASAVERQIRRTLSDPIRSQPIRELAGRLYRDAQQAQSKTIAVVGVGSESATHETLLYVGTLLVERSGADILLVDADVARRPLSEALESGDQRGLAELLAGPDGRARDLCRPTATDKLLLLPAGLSRHVDLSTTGPRLVQTLSQLRTDFSLVLIDGGRAADLAASALARQADGTYFVVRLGTVETSEAQAALASFRAAGARVLGCIAT